MRLPIAFDPIESGEIDNFAFDYSADIGNAAMVSTSWTCTFITDPVASDPDPQSRVISASTQDQIQIRSPIDGTLITKTGFFSVAKIGNCPTSAQGGTYILDATLNLSDGRVLKLNSVVKCVAPGQM